LAGRGKKGRGEWGGEKKRVSGAHPMESQQEKRKRVGVKYKTIKMKGHWL